MKRIALLLAAALFTASAAAQQPPMTDEQAQQMVEAIQAKLRGVTTPGAAPASTGSAPAPASPVDFAQGMFRQITARQRQVNELAWPMLVAGASEGLCEARPRTGALIAEFVAGESDGAAWVDHVASGSPAAAAGLLEGDAIVAINGKRVKDTKRGGPQLDKAAAAGEPVVLELRRAGDPLAVTLTPVPACDMAVSMFEQTGGMFDTGVPGQIKINGALFAEAGDDDERRIVIAHEIAHHAKGHTGTRAGLAKAGRAIDRVAGFAGIPTFGVLSAAGAVATKGGDEKAADAVSLKFLAAVGISAEKALAFWERAENDQGHRFQVLTSAHPLTDGRIAALREVVARQAPVASAPIASESDL